MVPALIKAGHGVTGYDSNLYERCTFEAGGEIVEVPYKRKDIRDADITDLKGVDAVIHLAALSNDPLGNLDPELTYDINYRATASRNVPPGGRGDVDSVRPRLVQPQAGLLGAGSRSLRCRWASAAMAGMKAAAKTDSNRY
jgi:hypothetical protein